MKERNITLDYFKLILSFLVILVHHPILEMFPVLSYELSYGIARLTVPCFLIISGYFMQPAVVSNEKIKTSLLRFVRMYLVWLFIYSSFQLGSLLENPSIHVFLSLQHYHLWYMLSLILGSSSFFLLKKLKINDYVFIGLVISCALASVVMSRIQVTGIAEFIRRYVFFGFSLISIGAYIREKQLVNSFSINYKTIGLAVLLFIGLIFEAYYYYSYSRVGFSYLSSMLLAPLVILFVLKLSVYKPGDGYMAELSTSIYFIHIMVIWMVLPIFPDIGKTAQYILIVLFSMLISTGIIKLDKQFKIFL